ncbi:MAG TPA: VOC family protein [Acidimicrobiales bacterium]
MTAPDPAPAAGAGAGDGPGRAVPTAIGHVAVITADLDRFRAFYEDVIGLRTALVLRMAGPPGLRHALFLVTAVSFVHAVERPGYDPAADGLGTEIGFRGRVDHLAFHVASVADLEAVRDRLVAVGASEGVVTPLGPVHSVHFRDPDGLEGEVTATNPAWDPSRDGRDVVEDDPDPTPFLRLLAEAT